MKRHYSYFLIKPDGIRFLDEICNTLEEKYQSIKYYAVESFIDIIKKLYYKHYEEKGKKFASSFESYLYGEKELFGNETIMVLVSDNSMSYEELVKNVYLTKNEIRKKYANNNIGIVTNYGVGRENYVRFVYPNGSNKLPRIMQDLGNYRISDMNIIHSPDPDLVVTLKELDILLKEKIIDDKNLITKDMLNKMRKYKTSKFQGDMKELGYIGETKPDISGFVKAEIQEIEDSYR